MRKVNKKNKVFARFQGPFKVLLGPISNLDDHFVCKQKSQRANIFSCFSLFSIHFQMDLVENFPPGTATLIEELDSK